MIYFDTHADFCFDSEKILSILCLCVNIIFVSVCEILWYFEQTCEWNGLWMRNASLRPLAACENTTRAGDGKCVDPYSDPSIVI